MIFMYDNAWSRENKTASPHRLEFLETILPQLAPLGNIDVWGAIQVSEEHKADDDERKRVIRLCKTGESILGCVPGRRMLAWLEGF